MLWCSYEIVLYCSPIELLLLLILVSFLLIVVSVVVALLLRLKVWPRDVFPLKIWVIHPSWIVVGVEVVLPLILA